MIINRLLPFTLQCQSFNRYVALTDARSSSSLFAKVSPLAPLFDLASHFICSPLCQILVLSGWLPSIISPAIIALPQVTLSLSPITFTLFSFSLDYHCPTPPLVIDPYHTHQAYARSGMVQGLVATAAAWVSSRVNCPFLSCRCRRFSLFHFRIWRRFSLNLSSISQCCVAMFACITHGDAPRGGSLLSDDVAAAAASMATLASTSSSHIGLYRIAALLPSLHTLCQLCCACAVTACSFQW